jgi:exopolyphosphatase/guanosine-5'-triphosphate,3'-diphosphate pyrophosphatase
MQKVPSSDLFVAIDLGSNSFHMWVVRPVEGSVQTIAKIKRKVRIAAGLDTNNVLSHEAMQRGWDCLQLFAERLQDIPANNIRIVGTAALRTATNIDIFLEKAKTILGYPIDVISGEKEAATIYQGVAHTSGGIGKRLVVDIGGASTELIIGEGFDAKALTSLEMGCVTWLETHFKDRQLHATNFQAAIDGAKEKLKPIFDQYTRIGWDVCVGASGTVQALQEIMLAQGMDETITLKKLKRLQRQAMQAVSLEELEIDGLTLERALVFPSGLSILIAIFEMFKIDSMTLAGGALREGMAYELIQDMRQEDIQKRTIESTQKRYQIDKAHADLVTNVSSQLFDACGGSHWCQEQQSRSLLVAIAQLHEIGMSIDFKKAGQHNAYLLTALDLPGFTQAQKQLLAELGKRYKDVLSNLPKQSALSNQSAERLLQILRISVLLCHRRNANTIAPWSIKLNQNNVELYIDQHWLEVNPLTAAELEIEANRQNDIGWGFVVEAK